MGYRDYEPTYEVPLTFQVGGPGGRPGAPQKGPRFMEGFENFGVITPI